MHDFPISKRKCALGIMIVGWLTLFSFSISHAQEGEDPLYSQVIEQARTLAAKPYAQRNTQLPPSLANLDYDSYRDIRFKPAQALWRGKGFFEVQFFHPGFLYREPVQIHIIEDGAARILPFDAALFDYGKNDIKDQLPTDLGFAGFRIHYPLNSPDYKDEVAVFLGASYFRPLGRNQIYGISARGLAINTALPEGEEFPAFREFWLVRPEPQATSMTLYALLDSASVTGAYRFVITPTTETETDVDATLFARSDIQRLGVAPMSSMFFFGESQLHAFDDYRPEVHDSDGVLMQTGKEEWIWRPLTNPKELRVTSLLDEAPRGFGLLQRDRRFEHYLDLESHFERRPSLWVEPRGGQWGKGAVYITEIPSDEEIHDNIVAFWTPDQPFKAGESRTFSYRLRALSAPSLTARQLGYVERTQEGWGAVPGTKEKPPHSLRHFVVDFTDGDLAMLSAAQPITAELAVSKGKVSDLVVQKLPGSKGWRASFRLTPDGPEPIDMRLFLALYKKRLTETWNYVWSSHDIN